MAKRKGKGKAGRRIKGWHGRYQSGEDTSAQAQRGRRHIRGVKLPTSRLEAPDENLDALPKVEGLVTAVYRQGALVRVAGRDLFCAIAKTFRAPLTTSALAVGDIVTLATTQEHHMQGPAEIDGERKEGFILSRRPRQTALSRPRPMSEKRLDQYGEGVFEQVIAANMDVLLIVASTRQPKLRRRLIDRFLIVAERGELKPVLVITKIDLGRVEEDLVAELAERGIPVVFCSAVTGQGMDELRRLLAGRRSVLAGASGVGKSTLVNALVPMAEAQTRPVRMKDERGRHTTAAAAVYDLPAPAEVAAPAFTEPAPPAPAEATPLPVRAGPALMPVAPAELPFATGPGGILVDTPGVRELGMAIDPQQLPWYFPEFEPFVLKCRFNNCSHTQEPGCAILAAVEAGQIPPHRYESYLMLRESMDDQW
jgi:ribosome biogenesis GTPase / thiamine phosphate phosphatase